MANEISAEQDALDLADEILAGKYPLGPYMTTAVFEPREWVKAAQEAIDGDCENILFMIERSEDYENGGGHDSADRWADEADYRYDMMHDEQMVSAWEAAQ